jgi:large subunit ribosomal protein L4e
MSRPLVSVYDPASAQKKGTVTLPAVFTAPIRGDVVNYVHNLMSKNARQAYGSFARAGMEVS